MMLSLYRKCSDELCTVRDDIHSFALSQGRHISLQALLLNTKETAKCTPFLALPSFLSTGWTAAEERSDVGIMEGRDGPREMWRERIGCQQEELSVATTPVPYLDTTHNKIHSAHITTQ